MVQSGVINSRGVLSIPFISQATHGALYTGTNVFTTAITTFSPYMSPFDSAPNTMEILYSKLTSEHGYRYYYIDCSRATMADQNSPRSVNITF